MNPDVTSQFRVYNAGQDLIGVAQVDLPAIQSMTTEVKGAGIAGTIDMPVIGMIQSMSMTFNFRTVNSYSYSLFAAAFNHLELWGSLQATEPGTGRLIAPQHKIITRGIFKNLTPGKFAVAETQDRTIEMEVIYFREMLAGREHLEVDKLNMIYRVDGVDQLAGVRANIGM